MTLDQEIEAVDIRITSLKMKKIMLRRGVKAIRSNCPRQGCGGVLHAQLDKNSYVHMSCQNPTCTYRDIAR